MKLLTRILSIFLLLPIAVYAEPNSSFSGKNITFNATEGVEMCSGTDSIKLAVGCTGGGTTHVLELDTAGDLTLPGGLALGDSLSLTSGTTTSVLEQTSNQLRIRGDWDGSTLSRDVAIWGGNSASTSQGAILRVYSTAAGGDIRVITGLNGEFIVADDGNVDSFKIAQNRQVLAASGGEGAPAYAFMGDPDTGMYNSPNALGFVTGGTLRAVVPSTGGFDVRTGNLFLDNARGVSIDSPAGSPVEVLAVESDGSTYVRANSGTFLRLQAAGVTGIELSSTQAAFLGGSAASPSMTFIGDADTGLYKHGDNFLGIATGGVIRLGVESTGVYLQSSAPLAYSVTQVTATGTTTADAAVVSHQSCSVYGAVSGTNGIRIRDGFPTGGTFRAFNRDPSNTLKVYPPTGMNFNDGSSNAPYTVPASSWFIAERVAGNNWYASDY